ncbi:MAG: hypothetical protein ACRD1C_05065 [Terriglobales bacterium]
MAECDRRFALQEFRFFSRCLAPMFDAVGIRCVNPPIAAYAIRAKTAQLLLARQCGMEVPRTFMGNSPSRITSRAPTGTRTVCKGFMPHVWTDKASGADARTVTFELLESHVDNEPVLTFAPAIYQELVAKRSDARVMLMGEAVRAFEIRSPALDWRVAAESHLTSGEEIEIPQGLAGAISQFAKLAGIVFGCFDFAIDNQGTWRFLEVNESGQFLWIDELVPGARIFEDFLIFLTAREGGRGIARSAFPSLSEFRFDPPMDSDDSDEDSPFHSFEGSYEPD